MRVHAVLAVLALGGCGLVYTAPNVYEEGDGRGFASDSTSDVQVIPMTFETALEANLTAYVPQRLPDSFRPQPNAMPGRIAVGDISMPNLPDIDAVSAGAGAGYDLPPTATALQPPAADVPVNLPEPIEQTPYRIGVSDVLLLSTNTSAATLEDVPSLLNAQSSRQGYVVQDDGAIAIPDVGRVRVSGMTIEEAEAEIFQALVAQRLDPSFSLEIAEFNSQRVSVGGAVRAPQVEPIGLKPLKLTEALQVAGGVSSEDLDYAVVRLFRDGQVYQAPLRDLYGSDALNDVLLKDGDAVFVDADYDLTQARAYFEEQIRLRQFELEQQQFEFQKRRAEIDDAQYALTLANFEMSKVQLRQQLNSMRLNVAQYDIQRNSEARSEATAQREAFKERIELGAVRRDYVYTSGELREIARTALPFESRSNLADILLGGGGMNIQYADYEEIYVIRQNLTPAAPGAVTAYRLDASNAASLSTATVFEMRPNDIVFVAEQPITSWGRTINQLVPNLIGQAVSLANAGS
ncbi:polysaccharide biosynthesis/export family protein [uncultured Albimonas sp.]|uniref:polysaccharide biosynthesis/export family protein n=1 Tax=uncultured Albimonas sp. TaxID=1331701 RepID=UPI0030EE726D